MKIVAKNRRAKFDYQILDELEAGIVLTGQEVKSAKAGQVSLKGSYATLKNNELWLINAHISAYQPAGPLPSYDPTRSRKLLLKKSELKSLIGKIRSEGLTIVPLSMYIIKRRLKVKLGLGKGKKRYDKRQAVKERQDTRRMKAALKRRSF